MSDNANKYVNLENLTYYNELLINDIDNKINKQNLINGKFKF